MFRGSTVVQWSRGQAVISLSSGEAEFYSIVTLVAELLALRSMCIDWNLDMGMSINSDATAAIAMTERRGLGRAKHVQTCYLWIQEKVQHWRMKINKVSTNDQLADALTKFITKDRMDTLLKRMGFNFRGVSVRTTTVKRFAIGCGRKFLNTGITPWKVDK